MLIVCPKSRRPRPQIKLLTETCWWQSINTSERLILARIQGVKLFSCEFDSCSRVYLRTANAIKLRDVPTAARPDQWQLKSVVSRKLSQNSVTSPWRVFVIWRSTGIEKFARDEIHRDVVLLDQLQCVCSRSDYVRLAFWTRRHCQEYRTAR